MQGRGECAKSYGSWQLLSKTGAQEMRHAASEVSVTMCWFLFLHISFLFLFLFRCVLSPVYMSRRTRLLRWSVWCAREQSCEPWTDFSSQQDQSQTRDLYVDVCDINILWILLKLSATWKRNQRNAWNDRLHYIDRWHELTDSPVIRL